MKSWQIHEYGALNNLQLGEARIPYVSSPCKVLVKVKAASVNPIDVAMISKKYLHRVCHPCFTNKFVLKVDMVGHYFRYQENIILSFP